MEQVRKANLNIDGVSKAGGGEYGTVDIDGVGTIAGDVKAEFFDSDGMAKVLGSLRADKLDSDGMLRIEGDLSAEEAVIDGQMKVLGALRGNKMKLNGLLTVAGDCELEEAELEGAFTVDGLLNAGSIRIRLHGKGKAREIGGETIQVRQAKKSVWNKLWRWMLPKFSPELEAQTIEGDDIDLEHTEAEAVRGNRVAIGKGCVIGKVEYRTELIRHPAARIGQEVKLGE